MPSSFKHKASHNASLRKVKFDKHMTSQKFNEILFGFFKVQKFSAKEFFSFSSSHQDNALSSVDDSLHKKVAQVRLWMIWSLGQSDMNAKGWY